MTAWVIVWRSRFPFSGVIVFAELSEFPDFSLDVFPMREQQGDRKQQDDDLFSAQGEKIHRIEGLSSRMGADPQILCSSGGRCQDGENTRIIRHSRGLYLDTRIGDPKIITFGIGAGVAFSGDTLLTATCAFALGVGADICVGWQNCQGDPGLTAWAIMR